jgi:hypothetical protein
MDEKRFDAFTRSLGIARSRSVVAKGLAGFVLGAVGRQGKRYGALLGIVSQTVVFETLVSSPRRPGERHPTSDDQQSHIERSRRACSSRALHLPGPAGFARHVWRRQTYRI